MDYWSGVFNPGFEEYDDYSYGDTDKEECSAEGLKGRYFLLADYIVFGIMFLVTAFTGVFYGCFVKKKGTAAEYLMGNRQMHYFPVAMSLIAGLLSAMSILGNPVEMYYHGSQLYMFCLAFLVSGPVAVNVYVPVFENLKITSAFEYIKLRFHNINRIFFSVMFLLQGLIFSAMTIYAPALALAQVTKMRVYIVVLVIFCICVFYGSIGGVKAIIWSDTIQIIMMFFALLALIIYGTVVAGGVDIVWNDSLETGRIEFFNFDPDPTVRQTFWSVFVGGTVYWTAICVANQNTIQRFLSMPSMREVNFAIWIATIAKIVIYTVLFYLGMLIFHEYKDCDPLASKMVQRTDQLLPLYLMEKMGQFPGFPGLLIATVFNTSVGAVATMLNGMAAVTVRDVVIGLFKRKLTEVEAGTYSKFICFGYGVVSLGFMFLITNMGGILQGSFSLIGVVGGVALGSFSLGMFFPWSNWKGALGGTLCGLSFMAWISLEAASATKRGILSIVNKPLSVDGCLCNATLEVPQESTEYIFPLYKVSYLWYATMGFVVSIITGMIISGIFGFQDPRELDQALISPTAKWVFNKLPQKMRNFLKLPVYKMDNKDQESISTSESIDIKKGFDDMDEITIRL